MAEALDVARFFLVLADASREDGEALTHLKLQKLLYYSQGFHLALYDTPLFPETIEAWEHGPVLPAIYRMYRECGRAPIDPPADWQAEAVSSAERSLLVDVWNAYGQFSAWRLREMTHEEPPWKDSFVPGANREIPHDSLKRYFLTQLA